MLKHEGVGMTEREKLIDLVDKVSDIYFALCEEEKKIRYDEILNAMQVVEEVLSE
mgnify:CR=1 FL=1